MREGIHPVYEEAIVHCSCGNTFTTRSTKKELHVELCDLCHPFYTGQQKFVDTGGRVQRFADKFGGAAESVMAKEAAAKQVRQKAHEDSVIAARQAREIKEREEAEAARKAAARAPKVEAVAEPVEAAVAVEEPVTAADETAVEAVAEAPAVEESPTEEPAVAESPAEEPSAEAAE
jgi:large subunit ribosomal protein L31